MSALELGRILAVNDNIARLLKHKLMRVMQGRDCGRWMGRLTGPT